MYNNEIDEIEDYFDPLDFDVEDDIQEDYEENLTDTKLERIGMRIYHNKDEYEGEELC